MSLTRALRTRTREAHARAEAALDVPRRGRHRADYTALLAGLRSVYAPLERALDAAAATPLVLPDWPEGRKTPWLDQDLAVLGAGLPPDVQVPPLATPEQVVGAAYVMEGATLGGALVLPLLADGLPHRFFAGYGPSRGARWRGFRRHVDALPGLDEDAVVEAALRSFALFQLPCTAAAR